MKTILLVLGLMAGVAQAVAMPRGVPCSVASAFTRQYPGAHVKEWEQRGNIWVAVFAGDRNKMMAYYISNGAWMKTETKIPWTKDLPAAVDISWKRSPFSNWYVAGVASVQYPDNKNFYLIKVQQDCGPDGNIPGDCVEGYNLYFKKDGSVAYEKPLQDDNTDIR